jgi:hypothetical protein
MDFILNELRWTMNDPKKFLPSAPYIMYMIERVKMITFPKDCKHEPLRIRLRSGDAPQAPPLHASATRNPRFDPTPSFLGASSSRHGHHDSFIKRALKSIFCMCKFVANEVNENRRDIIKIKNHLGLPTDPYHELPKLDDPFAEWDVTDEAAITAAYAPLPRPRRHTRPPTLSRRSQEIFDEDEETEEEDPSGYRENPNSNEDEDTSDEGAQDDDDE